MTRISQSEVLPNGVFIVKELAGESLVDDGDVLGSGRVALLDGAPSQQARADSLKVMGADPIPRGRGSLEVLRVSFDVHALVPVVASQRTVARQAGAEHAWNLGEALLEALVKPVQLL